MQSFRPLEQRLTRCQLKEREEKLMRSILGLKEGQLPTLTASTRRAWPELATTVDNFKLVLTAITDRRESLRKIKKALELPPPEFLALQQMQSFYKELTECFPAKSYSEIETVAKRFRRGARVCGQTGPSRFSLTMAQVRIANALLGFNREPTSGGMFEITKKLFPELASTNEIRRVWSSSVKHQPPLIYEKIKAAWQLPIDEYQKLLDCDPWYLKLARAYTERTEETLANIGAFIIRTRRLRPEKTITFSRDDSRKDIFLGLRSAPLWTKLTSRERQIISAYAGLDLPGSENRSVEQAAAMLNINKRTLSTQVANIKARLKVLEPRLPFFEVSRSSLVKPIGYAFGSYACRRMSDKKIFLELKGGGLWNRLTDYDKRVITAFYDLDSPDDSVPARHKVAQTLNIKMTSLSSSITIVKAKLKSWNPSLPFAGRSTESPAGGFDRPDHLESRKREKLVFLNLKNSALWNRAAPMHKEILTAYYGLDLPGDEVRDIRQAAKILAMEPRRLMRRIVYIKKRWKMVNSTLPFRVTPERWRSKIKRDGSVDAVEARPTTTFEYYRALINRFPDIDDNEIGATVQALASGDEQKRIKLLHAGLRDLFPVAFAWCVTPAAKRAGFDVMDLIQEGGLAFWSALPNFQGQTRTDLRAFVCESAKKGIKLALRRAGESVGIGANFTSLVKKINRAWNSFLEKKQKEPTPEDLAVALRLPLEEIVKALSLMQISVRPNVFLDENLPGKDGDSRSYYEIVPNPKAPTPEQVLEHQATTLRDQWLAESAERALRTRLSLTEQQILSLRYGFAGEEPQTQLEIARLLGTTENEIQTIESEALKKIRSAPEVVEKIRRFAEQPRVTITPFRLSALSAVPSKKDAVEKEPPLPFVITRHRWEEMRIDERTLREEAEENPNLAGFIKEGLIPARTWYRHKSRVGNQ